MSNEFLDYPRAVSDHWIGCIKGEDATVEKIGPVIFKLKVAVNDVIADVKVLGSLPLERILRTFAGGVLDAVAIAKLLACLLNVSAFDLLLE